MKKFLLITAIHALAQVNHEQLHVMPTMDIEVMPTMDIELAAPPTETPVRENSIARPLPEKEEVATFIFRVAREPYKPPSPGLVVAGNPTHQNVYQSNAEEVPFAAQVTSPNLIAIEVALPIEEAPIREQRIARPVLEIQAPNFVFRAAREPYRSHISISMGFYGSFKINALKRRRFLR